MSDLTDEIAMEWKRVPMLPTAEHFDRAWRNILDRARKKHGAEAVTKALSTMEDRYNGTVPHEDV